MYIIFHDNIYLTQTNVGTNVDSGVRRHMASMGYTDLFTNGFHEPQNEVYHQTKQNGV